MREFREGQLVCIRVTFLGFFSLCVHPRASQVATNPTPLARGRLRFEFATFRFKVMCPHIALDGRHVLRQLAGAGSKTKNLAGARGDGGEGGGGGGYKQASYVESLSSGWLALKVEEWKSMRGVRTQGKDHMNPFTQTI
jgi:hypothetical protein